MGKVVSWNDIDQTQSGSTTVTTSSTELLPSRLGKTRRTQIIIQNTSATVLTLLLGDADAVANVGIRLAQNQQLIMADDAGFKCWQGAIHAVASAASTVVYVETAEQ